MMARAATRRPLALDHVARNLRSHPLRLGVTAPVTAQGASFQKYDCSNAGTIVHRELLDIEHQSHTL